MAFTIHGHQIPLSPIEPDDLMTEKPARCGGPNVCHTCDVNVTEWQKAAGLRPGPQEFMLKGRIMVANYFNAHTDVSDRGVNIGPDQVYVVSFMKTLKNWKGMFSTTVPDGMYYELTHNGEDGETYLDAYKKHDNVLIPD